MKRSKISDVVRASGYELLFLLAGAAAVAMRPTWRNLEHPERLLDELRGRRGFPGLVERGLVEADPARTKDVLKLTELGTTVLHGGRQPDQAWAREWDGKWRLITFDLPKEAGQARVRFWRWLTANRIGRLQGSVWISAEAVPGIEEAAAENGFEPSAVLVFSGELSGGHSARAVAAQAWDFGTINDAHHRYREFAERSVRSLRGTSGTGESVRRMLREDRRLWWLAVKRDPLLPEALHPKGYAGPRAWQAREALFNAISAHLLAGAGA